MKALFISCALLLSALSAFAQGYQFTEVVTVPATPVKNQAATGTCWCFATTSFMESELLRMGKGEYDLSEMFIVRQKYMNQLQDNYLRRGEGNIGQGSLAHTFKNAYRQVGIVPEEVYKGINYNSERHNHSEMAQYMKAIADVAVKNKKRSPEYDKLIQNLFDTYLGQLPATFTYKGKEYTPKTFAKSLGLNMDAASEIKKNVSHIKVGVVGSMSDPALCDRAIAEGKVDFVILCRQLMIADPDFPNKAEAGLDVQINNCLRCTSCRPNGRCAVNPGGFLHPKLTRTVHQYGAKIFAQLHHGGATSKSAFTGRQNLSPSGIPMAPGGEVPREMTLEDIKRVQDKFVAAAVRCKKAGYDGVELHGAHSYLLAEFFSKYYNRRTDAYGGSLENRCRFIDEIIAGIRAKLGRYPISVRICGDEMTDEPGFLTLEDGLEIGRHLEVQGIDCINISNGSSWNGNANCEPFSYTPGWKKHVAKAFKEALSIPVIATNTIKDPDFAESLLEEGVSDFVALGRSQFADPEFMNKARAGKPESIRKCIGCMYCRERLLGNAMPVECSLNPRLGREYRYRWQDLQKNGNSRPVVVVGGGPGGLECAVILAKRGFAVTLLEKEAALGGTLNIAKLPPHKANLQDVTDVLALEARELGVTVKLNTEATPETVAALHPVGVFLAAGAPPVVPKSIPGIDKAVLAEDVILGKAPCTGKVVLVGTGLTGLECAEMILEQGHSLAMVEMNPTVGQGIFGVVFNDIYSRIKPYDPAVYTSHRLTAVTDTGVTVEDMATGETKTIAADTVVLAMGTHSQEAMEASYRAAGLNAILVGSAEMPGRIAGATRDGFEKAWGFEAE